MVQIKESNCGVLGIATQIEIRVLPFSTTDKSCGTYYRLADANNKSMAEGNIALTEEQFANWGEDNAHVEDIVLAELGLERK